MKGSDQNERVLCSKMKSYTFSSHLTHICLHLFSKRYSVSNFKFLPSVKLFNAYLINCIRLEFSVRAINSPHPDFSKTL